MATKFGTKLTITIVFVLIGGFGDGPSNDAKRIFLRVTLIVMATKFGT